VRPDRVDGRRGEEVAQGLLEGWVGIEFAHLGRVQPNVDSE
jgi:hypothetical protein